MNGALKGFMLWHNVLLNLMLASIMLVTTVAAVARDSPSAKTQASNALLQSLTEIERAWLRGHPVIRVAQAPDWSPVEFADERGKPSGMSEDYLKLIEQRLGVTFERVRNLSWREAYDRLKRWEIDMTTSVTVTPERTKFWAFTKPYMKIPNVIFADMNVTYIADMRELAGKKVAVADGYAVSEWIQRDYPDIQLVKVKNVQEGLEKLQGREASAYIGDMLVSGYYLTKLKMTTLKIAGNTPYVNAQSMAIRKDWATLAVILDKALDSISESERNEIYRKWLPIRYEQGFDYTLLWQALAVFTLILLGLFLWIRRLAREIKQRKQAEAASEESARRFRQLFDITAMPLCLVDKDGVLKEFNNRFVQTFGYTHEDVPTLREWWQLAYPDPYYRHWVIETWNTAVRRAAEEDKDIDPVEYKVTCKNGEVRTFVISGSIFGDDFLATFFDVTDRNVTENEQRQLLERTERSRRALLSALEDQKRVDEALRASEEQYRQLFETSPVAIYLAEVICDAESRPNNIRFIYVNPAFERMTLMRAADLVGRTIFEVLPVDHAAVERQGRVALSGVPDHWGGYNFALNIYWEATVYSPRHGQCVTYLVDITKRKRIEEDLRKYQDHLEEMVKERTNELGEANLRLQELDRLKSMFIASMSHELRTPLNSIIGFTGIILMGMSGEISAIQKKQLGMVKNSANHLLELINDVIDVSKIEAGKADLNIEAFNLSDLAQEVRETFAIAALKKRLNLEWKTAGGVEVTSDRRRVRQILVNLIGNAVKFTETGTVEIVALKTAKGAEITVRDTGVGIHREDMERLFQAFSRIHFQDCPVVEGTGLGLYLSRRIAALLGGEITVESEPGRGSEFTFSLPWKYPEVME